MLKKRQKKIRLSDRPPIAGQARMVLETDPKYLALFVVYPLLLFLYI